MVYKNFEKNYTTYRRTWSGVVEAEEPEPDTAKLATSLAAEATTTTTTKAAA